jgi:hypothetical protein
MSKIKTDEAMYFLAAMGRESARTDLAAAIDAMMGEYQMDLADIADEVRDAIEATGLFDATGGVVVTVDYA